MFCSGVLSVPQSFVDEHDFRRAVAVERAEHGYNPAADAVGAGAVVALHLLTERAGGLAVQAFGVEGSRDIPRAPEGAFGVRRNLVDARNQDHPLVAVEGCGNAVARTVDIDDFARLGDGVGGAEVDLRQSRLPAGFRVVRAPVPVDGVVRRQPFVQTEGFHGQAAADADGFAVDGGGDVVRRFRGGVERACRKAAAREVLEGEREGHGGSFTTISK